jgi:hypothetical protein
LGHALWCQPHEQQIGALCYGHCDTGYTRVALTCWKDKCPKSMMVCGAQCILDRMNCTAQITALTVGTLVDIAGMVATAGATSAAKAAAQETAKMAAKAGAKAAAKFFFKQFIKEVVKLFSKEGAKKLLKEFAKKLVKTIIKSGLQHWIDEKLATGVQNPIDYLIEKTIKDAVGSAANIMDYMDSCSLLQWGKCADLVGEQDTPWVQGQMKGVLDEFAKSGTLTSLRDQIKAVW